MDLKLHPIVYICLSCPETKLILIFLILIVHPSTMKFGFLTSYNYIQLAIDLLDLVVHLLVICFVIATLLFVGANFIRNSIQSGSLLI